MQIAVAPVKKAWNQQRRFVADASHELKTPLTVILANNEILMSEMGKENTKQKKFIESSQHEAEHMKNLINDLLFLARSDIDEAVFIEGDSTRIFQLVHILLDNAVKYTEEEGCVMISLKESAGQAVLKVANAGEPLDGDELEHIFERFYRTDKARSSEGGFGLGLSIARTIAETHGGRITAGSEQMKQETDFEASETHGSKAWTVITVQLPLK